MNEKHNGNGYARVIVLIILIAGILLAERYAPPVVIPSFSSRLVSWDEYHAKPISLLSDLATEHKVDMLSAIDTSRRACASHHPDTLYRTDKSDTLSLHPCDMLLGSDTLSPPSPMLAKEAKVYHDSVEAQGVMMIEDFSFDGSEMERLLAAVRQCKDRSVHIAFMGDSYIEGDIITSELRASLQRQFGGVGVGFVPLAPNHVRFRKQVKLRHDGWTEYSVVSPSPVQWQQMMISGYYYEPNEEAQTEVILTTPCDTSCGVSRASLFYVNTLRSQFRYSCSSGADTLLAPAASPAMQRVSIDGDIHSVRLSFLDPTGFRGYGVYLQDSVGMYVDNYAVRGTSGVLMRRCGGALWGSFAAMIPYDLVILEYGLNVVERDRMHYGSFMKSFSGLIDSVQMIYPRSSILVMGVGDRGCRERDEVITMPCIEPFVDAQREVAKEQGVLFWDTYRAMGGRGAIAEYVDRGWAAKDYTHLSLAGGRELGRKLYEAIMVEVNRPRGAQGYDGD